MLRLSFVEHELIISLPPYPLDRSGLSFLALGFDTLFLIQHFILYRGAEHEDEREVAVAADPERDRLIPPAAAV